MAKNPALHTGKSDIAKGVTIWNAFFAEAGFY